MTWLATIWHFLFGWPSVDILVGCAAVAVAVLEPPIVAAIIPDLRKWAICAAVVAFTFLGISGKYFNDGLAFKQAQWDAALERQAVAGEEDRSAAAASVGPVSPDRSVFRGDPYNRDGAGPDGTEPQSKVRGASSHHLFGKW